MMTPKPTERLKKIWLAALIHTCGLARTTYHGSSPATGFGFHMNPSPLRTLRSGWAGSGVPRLKTRASTMKAHMAMSGIPQVHTFSMPFSRPRKIRKKFTVKVSTQKTTLGWMLPSSMIPSRSAPTKRVKCSPLLCAHAAGSGPRSIMPKR